MNSIRQLLDKHFVIEECDSDKCCSLVLDYVFRCLSVEGLKSELSSKAKLRNSSNFSEFREELTASGYVFKNVKLWIFYLLKIKASRITLHNAADFDVLPHDLVLFDLISYKTRNTIKKWSKTYKALSLRRMDENLCKIEIETSIWIKKFVYRKLRFIAESQGMDLMDIERELWLKGMIGLFMMYPKVESSLHALNIVKRVMHNHGMNLIKQYTHIKRARLIRDVSGAFINNSVDFALLDLETEDDGSADLRIDLHRIVQSATTEERSLLSLLCGVGKEDTDFYAYLNNIGIKSEPDTLMNRIGLWGFLRHAARFLVMTFNDVVKFIKTLQWQLRDYRFN